MVPSRTAARLVIVTLLAGAVLAALPAASADDVCAETATAPTSACAGLESRWSYLLLPKPAGCDEVAGQCVPEGIVWGPEHVDFVLVSVHASVDTGLCQVSTFCRVDVDTASVTDRLLP